MDKFDSNAATSDLTVSGLESISNLDNANLSDGVLLATVSKPAHCSHQDETLAISKDGAISTDGLSTKITRDAMDERESKWQSDYHREKGRVLESSMDGRVRDTLITAICTRSVRDEGKMSLVS